MLHRADIHWAANGDFRRNRYSRAHEWRFDGGAVVPASASPDIVPVPLSAPEAVDPEEAFVAALSSCHMLWFLDFARRAGFSAARYHDAATGRMTRNDDGNLWVSRVDLTISVDWDGDAPDPATHEALHHKAHAACYIANSVRTEVVTTIVKG
jgi:organic hydroperoxide reductase OsmC/OhrA